MPKFEKGKPKTGGIQKGTKHPKTEIKEGLGLTSTKDIPKVVIEWANRLHKQADGDFNKEIQIWKELAKAGLPKTQINVDESFEDFLRRHDETN